MLRSLAPLNTCGVPNYNNNSIVIIPVEKLSHYVLVIIVVACTCKLFEEGRVKINGFLPLTHSHLLGPSHNIFSFCQIYII